MNSSPLVSVLVPLHNSGVFFEKCLSSICSQSYSNLEIIIADDASDDESPAYARAFAAKDSRIRYFSLERGGSAAARNAALKQARGEYIVWVDSDDFVHENYVSHLLELCRAFAADAAMCRFEAVASMQSEFCNPFESEGPRLMDFIAYMDAMFSIRESEIMVLWNKIYKRELWQDFFFDTAHFLDDRAVWKIIKKSGKIAVSTRTLYYYVQTEASLMRNPENTVKHVDAISYMDEIYAFAVNRGNEGIAAKAWANRLFIILGLRKNLRKSKEAGSSATLKLLSGKFFSALAKGRKSNGLKFKLRLKMLFWYIFPHFYSDSKRHREIFT